VTDRQTDSADRYYSWSAHCGGPANIVLSVIVRMQSRLDQLPGVIVSRLSDRQAQLNS